MLRPRAKDWVRKREYNYRVFGRESKQAWRLGRPIVIAEDIRSDPSKRRLNAKTVGVRSGSAEGWRWKGGEGWRRVVEEARLAGTYYRAAAETELLHG